MVLKIKNLTLDVLVLNAVSDLNLKIMDEKIVLFQPNSVSFKQSTNNKDNKNNNFGGFDAILQISFQKTVFPKPYLLWFIVYNGKDEVFKEKLDVTKYLSTEMKQGEIEIIDSRSYKSIKLLSIKFEIKLEVKKTASRSRSNSRSYE